MPIDVRESYTDYLPSLNLRYELRGGLYLRAAASRTITRPDFKQLSPSLSLVRNPIVPSLNQGSAGNPNLRPIRARNLDIAIEKHFGAGNCLYVTGFVKQVDGFVTTVSGVEVHDGETYQVSRPQNTAPADIDGFEIGYQQFYDFLPGWLEGFGLQANYTYVASETPDTALGTRVPLQNLSRHSYNVIGIYERGPLSARIAYNWRDGFFSGSTSVVGVGVRPVHTSGYGWLDASASCRINDAVSISFESLNLLRTLRSSNYGTPTRPQSRWRTIDSSASSRWCAFSKSAGSDSRYYKHAPKFFTRDRGR